HRSVGSGPRIAARFQELDEVVGGPSPKPRPKVAGETRCVPVLYLAAREVAVALRSAREVLWRVAGAAMPESFDQVGSAIPFRRLLRIWLEGPLAEEQFVPTAHDDAIVQRPGEVVIRSPVVDWVECIQIGADRVSIFASDLGVPRIGKSRIEPTAVCRDAFMELA